MSIKMQRIIIFIQHNDYIIRLVLIIYWPRTVLYIAIQFCLKIHEVLSRYYSKCNDIKYLQLFPYQTKDKPVINYLVRKTRASMIRFRDHLQLSWTYKLFAQTLRPCLPTESNKETCFNVVFKYLMYLHETDYVQSAGWTSFNWIY